MDQRTWDDWLEEEVVWNCREEIPRRVALRRFVYEGLIPFIKSYGYAFEGDLNIVGSNIATGLYENANRTYGEWKYGLREELLDETEYKNYYRYTIDYEAWKGFWDTWGVWCDLDDEQHERRCELESYIWTQLSIERSKPTKIVNELLGVEETEENVTEHECQDTYFKEMVE